MSKVGSYTVYYGGADASYSYVPPTSGEYGVVLTNKANILFDSTTTGKSSGIIFADGTTLSSAKGSVGPTGPAGQAGSAGAKGDMGPTGPAGPAGSTSAKGDTGSVGPTGPAGAKGDTGLAGSTGSAGAKGDTGLAGPTGAKGDTGLAGPTGSAGAKGDTGLAGSTGSAGTKGDTGPTGPSGSSTISGHIVIDKPNTSFDVSGVTFAFNTNSNPSSLIYFVSPKTGSQDKPTVVFNCNVQFNGYIVSGQSKCTGSTSTDTALNVIGDINTSGNINSDVTWKT